MNGVIFGFGSLVNKNSIQSSILAMKNSKILGYKRRWIEPFTVQGTVYRALGVVESGPFDFVHGVTIFVPKTTLQHLYTREASYRRLVVDAVDEYGNIDYATTFETREAAPDEARIPISYVATVAEGFVDQYGANGLDKFIDNTDGWEHGIIDDSDDPVYPRPPDRLKEVIESLRPRLANVAKITSKNNL